MKQAISPREGAGERFLRLRDRSGAAAGREAGPGALSRSRGRRGAAGAGRAAVGEGVAAGGRRQGERLLLLRPHPPHRVPVHRRQPDAAALLLEADMDGLAAAAAAGDGAGRGALWLRRAGLPQGDAGEARGRVRDRPARGRRGLAPVDASHPRAVADQSAGDADGGGRRLPSGGRLRLRGQQPRAAQCVQRRRGGSDSTSSSRCSRAPATGEARGPLRAAAAEAGERPRCPSSGSPPIRSPATPG